MKETPKVANSESRVRRQNRKKNSAAMRKPVAVMPDRNSNMSIELPDEAVQQRRQRRDVYRQPGETQIDSGQEHQIDDDKKIVERKKHKARRRPQQQRRSRANVAAHQKPAATRAGGEAKEIHDRCDRVCHSLILKASDRICNFVAGDVTIFRITAVGLAA